MRNQRPRALNLGGISKRKHFRLLSILSFLILLLGIQPMPEAHAANIEVDTAADETNTNGLCSLREAIINANSDDQSGSTDCAAGTGDDRITFAATMAGETITLGGAQLGIAGNLTITGLGADQLTISGDDSSRVFNIFSGTVTIKGLTIQGGNGQGALIGGGIVNQSTLTVENSVISGNRTSTAGGGICNDGILILDNSTVTNNRALANGGGIVNFDTLTLKDSTVSSNKAGRMMIGSMGGGIDNKGTLTMNGSTISDNLVFGRGAGINNSGTLEINDSIIKDNEVLSGQDGGGGGINNVGDLAVSGSTISDNIAVGLGGGIDNNAGKLTLNDSTISGNWGERGGGIYSQSDMMMVTDSTINNNKTNYDGGGIHNENTMTLINVTISGNQAARHGGGICSGLWSDATANLNNVTISKNIADSLSNGSTDGGGIYMNHGSVHIENSIVAGNQDKSGAGNTVHPDCSGTLTSGGYNLVQDTAGCSGLTATDITGQESHLETLADNGGETETHAPQSNSPAIDAGNPAGCQDDDGNDLTTDQRGEPRPYPTGGHCDIGAYEIQQSFPNLEVVKANDVGGFVTLGTTFQWTVTISNTGGGDAVFNGGETIFQDDLPAGATYGTPTVQNVTDVTNSGDIDCQLIGTTLRCVPDGADVTLSAETSSFDVGFDVTPSATGDLTNPDPNGICQVDPDDHIAERNERDNACTDTVTVLDKPDLQVTKANDTEGTGVVGTAFEWAITLSNGGASDATFADGQTMFRDDLPSTAASYGTPRAQNFTDITNSGNVDCNIVGMALTCMANGADVTFGAVTGSFDVTIEVTPNVEGDLTNPDLNGICQIDPDDHVDEDDESDNECADTVTVTVAGGDGDDNGSGISSRNCPVGVPGGICRLKNMVKTTVFENTVLDGSYIRIKEKSGGNFKLGDRVFDVTIIGPDGEAIPTFDPPIEVCLRPTNAELQAAGWSYGNLTLFHSHAGGPWEAIYNTYEQDGKVCAKVWQLSRFALGVAPLPDTGFAPGLEHTLPTQPAEKAYVDLLGVTASEAWQSPRQRRDRFVVQSNPRDENFVLEIPSLDLELPIVGVPLSEDGWDVRWLGAQAGWLQGTAFPTWVGNTAITAHVWDTNNDPGPFVDLDTLQHGDEIIIHAWGLTHTYEVRAVEQVRPDDLCALPHEDYDVLTLLTCQGFDEAEGVYNWRLAVRAVLMDVEAE